MRLYNKTKQIEKFIKTILPIINKNKQHFSHANEDSYSFCADFWYKERNFSYRTLGQSNEFKEELKIYDDYGYLRKVFVFRAPNLFDQSRHIEIYHYQEYNQDGEPYGIWCEQSEDTPSLLIITDYTKGIKNKIIYEYTLRVISFIAIYQDGSPIQTITYKDGKVMEERYFSNARIIKKCQFSPQGTINKIVIYDEMENEKITRIFDEYGLELLDKRKNP